MPFYKDTNNRLHSLSEQDIANGGLLYLPASCIQISDDEVTEILEKNNRQEQNSTPQIVSAAKGGIALIQSGFMPAVEAVINDPTTPAEVKWAWNRSTEWERNSTWLAYIALHSNITESQMDDLFIDAGRIFP